MIRAARESDLERLRDIERAAGSLFLELDMRSVAEDEPPTIGELSAFQRAGRAWVATEGDHPVGYLLLSIVDGDAHVEQVSVHPAWSGRGLGGALVDTAATWAVRLGMHAMTLTTFRDVPWNAPYYERLGFRVIGESEWGPQLRHLREEEVDRGLDRWRRVAMRRSLGSASGASPEQ